MAANRWFSSGNYFTRYKDAQRLFKTRTEMILFLLLGAFLFTWPLWMELNRTWIFFIDNIMILIIAMVGLNFTTGFTGLPNIGHAALIGTGAYFVISIHLLTKDTTVITHYWPLVISGAAIFSGIVGALVGLPSLRLKRHYLIIATLAFQVTFVWAIQNTLVFNQGETINVERAYWMGEKIGREEHNTFWYYAILSFVLLSFLLARNILRSRYGRMLVGVRDNDRAAEAMGIHPGWARVFGFALGGIFAGLAGGLRVYLFRGTEITSFHITSSIEYLSMAVVGGLGFLSGPLFGVTTITFLEDAMFDLAAQAGSMTADADLARLKTALKPLAYGTATILILMFQPQGLAYVWRIVVARIKVWPLKP